MIKSYYGFIRDLVRRVRRALELRKYNRFTIAEYFRKQGAQIGKDCSIIPTSLGTEPYLIKIGNHVTIAAGVLFMTHDGATWLIRHQYPNIQGFGPIVIGDNCVIGANAMLFQGIKIGPNSIVGAGSVVISDVPANTIVIGVPARPFGSVDKYREKCVTRWSIQQPPDSILENGEDWWNSKHYSDNRQKLKKHLLTIFEKELSG